jgi:2'-5' RNA ligase
VTDVERLRLFVAADVPEDRLSALDEDAAELKGKLEARWAPLENQHVTLKFLGTTLSDRLDEVLEAVRIVARSHASARLSVADLGAFPSPRRARVLWAGLDDPEELTPALARDLDAAMEPLGYRAEKRAFTPHLTLARFKVPAKVEGLLFSPGEAAREPFALEAVHLYRSRLSPKGARYEVLEEIPLS